MLVVLVDADRFAWPRRRLEVPADAQAALGVDVEGEVGWRCRDGSMPASSDPSVEMMADQVRQHFRIGCGLECVAGLRQAFLDASKILDHTIMNDGDASALVEVRV